jgi:sugar lactone lactonase YvrE
MADGIEIRYANDVDVARDGKIYFTDASTIPVTIENA